MQKPGNYTALLEKLINGTCSPEERETLIEWLSREQPDEQALAWLSSYFDRPENPVELDANLKQAFDGRLTAILQKDQSPVRRIITMRWLKYAAAIVILLAAGLYFYLQNQPQKATSIAENNFHRYVDPGHHRAVLTLGDKSTIILDTAGFGLLARQGVTTIEKIDTGKIIYQLSAASKASADLNTVTTPLGGEYQVVLPDGTHVWMNAGSSITFPTVFTGSQREVVLNGEAYFEVTKNAAMPFIVATAKDRIKVLGTHFNVNAYTDEPGIKTSLLEGSVQVGNKLLHPGQAYINGRVVNTNVIQDIAWKNGLFNFDNKAIEEIMRQLARWYSLDIVYREKVGVEFFAEMPRSTSIENALRALELTGRVHFKKEGKKVTVFK